MLHLRSNFKAIMEINRLSLSDRVVNVAGTVKLTSDLLHFRFVLSRHNKVSNVQFWFKKSHINSFNYDAIIMVHLTRRLRTWSHAREGNDQARAREEKCSG